MTRVDQAFIKVYTDQGGALPTSPDSLDEGSPTDAPAAHSVGHFQCPTDERPPEQPADPAVDVSVDGVLEALQATAARIADLLPPEEAPESPQAGADDRPAHEGPDPPTTNLRVDRPAAAGSAAWQADGQPVRRPHILLSRADSRAGGSGPRCADGEPSDQTFQPMLQVDHFNWPGVCCRLGEVASQELDSLLDGLADVRPGGKRVVAIGGCRRGEGATTLLLCAGRGLAERGLKVVMADANLADPQLACRLGLLPQAGWEDVLSGRLPLEEVVIESVGDRLAVLPVRHTSAATGETAEDKIRLAQSIRTLAAHYDLVLLDPGPLEELDTVGASLARGIGNRLDAIALVHHGRVTPPEDLEDVVGWLAAAEITQVGVIENFVRD